MQDTEQQLELQACCAAALYPRGGAYAEAATHLLMKVLDSSSSSSSSSSGSSSSVPATALRQYAVIAADRQLWGEVVKVAVRLLAKVPGDKQGRQLLARAVQDPAGMQQMLADVGSSPGTPAAFAFLATVLKDSGAVQQAVQLFQKAVQLQPDSSRYALGLAHCLELGYDYAGVLRVVLAFCAACGPKRVGPLQLKYGSLQEAVAATVDFYITLLLQLVQQHKLRVYVHPVPPILNETRHIFSLFNAALQQRLSSVLQAQPELIGQLEFLDFAQQLLTDTGSSLQQQKQQQQQRQQQQQQQVIEDSGSLQQQLVLDGTHLHPRYLVHLGAALNAAPRNAAAGVDG
ncbi:hypothetical protein OEZ86_001104 [Tetradesmus obliquus]|nr:hypothetical protein OEZ86_001104 [Tetradesmus obliquus]